jgi:guanylate kinase
MSNSLIICLVGPSGSGKTTIADWLYYEVGLVKFVTATTRDPRTSEVNGVHYHFLTEHDFLQAVSYGQFWEHQEVHGNLYGLLNSSIESGLQAGRKSVVVMDVNGAMKLKAEYPNNVVTVFVTAGGFWDNAARVRGRGVSEDTERRVSRAEWELQHYLENSSKYDYLFLNHNGIDFRPAINGIIEAECAKREI